MTTLIRRIAVPASALLALVGLIAGVPALLISTIGNPLPPDTIGMTTRLSDDALLGLIAIAAWVLWAQFLGCVLLEMVAEVRFALGRTSPLSGGVPGTFAGQQRLARSLVHALVAGGIGAASLAAPSVATPVAEAAPFPEQSSFPRGGDPAVEEPSQAPALEVVVTRGDTLWGLAERHLGAGERWREIADLNRGRTMVDGTHFTDGNALTPGWELLLPREATPHRAAAGSVVVQRGDTLWGLAEDAYGDGGRWPRIYRNNRDSIEDPDLIYVGQVFDIPPSRSESEPSGQARGPSTRRGAGAADAEGELRLGTEVPPGKEIVPDLPDQVDGGAPEESAATDSFRNEALLALSGAGALLGGGLLAALIAQRRRQYRERRSGRVVARTPLPIVPVEAAIRSAGSEGLTSADFIDKALRELVAVTRSNGGTTLPDVLAAELSDSSLVLLLGERPGEGPPAPWSELQDGLSVARERGLPLVAADVHAPYPLLVTLGLDESGSTWLVDLEAAGITHLTGSAEAVAALARHLAAEAAVNRWSDHVDILATSDAETLLGLHPERVRAVEPHELLQGLVGRVHHAVDSAQVTGHDVLRGRLDGSAAEAWMPMLAVIQGQHLTSQEVEGLRQEAAWLRGRSATALLIVGGEQRFAGAALHLELRSDGWLTVEPLGLKLKPAGLAHEILRGAADLLEAHRAVVDETPASAHEGHFGDAVDVLGAIREASAHDAAGSPASLLPMSDDHYLASSATTERDLQALAPVIDAEVSERILALDPDLDQDLADWNDPACARPRIRVLGPVELMVAEEPTGDARHRRAFATEIVAYLFTRPHGATSEQIAAEFDLRENVVHNYMTAARKWVGTDPSTDTPYLPECTKTVAARRRGVGVYQLTGALSDQDLFLRLRARAQARGAEGLGDLITALHLVKGRPFDHLRRRGYGWLSETPLDHQLSAAIVDVAHVVAVRCLEEGDLGTAQWAAETAILAAPDEEKPRLDLRAVLEAKGGSGEARAVEELTERGWEIVERWEGRG